MDGVASFKAIRAVNPEAIVAMISAIGRRDKIKDSILAGAREFITKLFQDHQVISVVRNALKC